jgi:hypothetical protein
VDGRRHEAPSDHDGAEGELEQGFHLKPPSVALRYRNGGHLSIVLRHMECMAE